MKFAGTLIIILSFLPVAGYAQGNAASLHPTPLEAFAKQTSSRVAWSSEVGRIDSKEGHAVITALVVEDTAQPPDRLRGIRIDLADQDGKDQVYLGEETLGAFKDATDQISRDAARGCSWNSGGACSSNLFVGAALFWYADRTPRVHTLTAAHYFMQGSSGWCSIRLVLEDSGSRIKMHRGYRQPLHAR